MREDQKPQEPGGLCWERRESCTNLFADSSFHHCSTTLYSYHWFFCLPHYSLLIWFCVPSKQRSTLINVCSVKAHSKLVYGHISNRRMLIYKHVSSVDFVEQKWYYFERRGQSFHKVTLFSCWYCTRSYSVWRWEGWREPTVYVEHWYRSCHPFISSLREQLE